jgi:alpha-L-arabinofuranosidase
MISCSSSLKDRKLTMTLVNAHFAESAEIEVVLAGARGLGSSSVSLSAPDPHDCNTFDRPDRVLPTAAREGRDEKNSTAVLPPASLTALEVALG